MSDRPAISLMRGVTSHVRNEKFRHRFRYGVTLIEVDVDRLSEADACSAIFSVDRKNLVSLNTRKRVSGEHPTPGGWARSVFDSAGIETINQTIRLITFPTTEFYAFAPLSVWLLSDESERPRAVIYDVNNTFGERHAYVGKVAEDGAFQIASKCFHVSPFFDLEGQYRFRLKTTSDIFHLRIETVKNESVAHTAVIKLNRTKASTASFLRFLFLSPFSGIGVSLAIHWQALRLFFKGATYHRRPSMPENEITLTTHIKNTCTRN